MDDFNITRYGKQLDESLYVIDLAKKTFTTNENSLVLDFTNEFDELDEWTFKTGSYCTFKTGSYCTFNTGNGCTFDTGSYCTFDTGVDCTFDTGICCKIVCNIPQLAV